MTLKFETKSPDNETVFLDHYDWLLDWARQHTQGALQEAEDMVQDLYVRFVQMKRIPSFKDEDHVRAYLYTSLKNLFISRKLRSGRDAVAGLLAVDFDSIEFAMSSVDRSQLLHVRSDLAGICEYACNRRRTSRAGSVLILRYFLGYLSTEVTALLMTKRSNVDTLVETARLEAKAYLDRPGVLRFLSRNDRKPLVFPRYLPDEPEALFAELQRRIFLEAEGECLQPQQLRDRYIQPGTATFTTQEIAHLASCRQCLSIATRSLGIPDLALRSFGEGEQPEDSEPPSVAMSQDGLKKLRRKLRQTYEHRPKKLQLVVDGEVRGVQTITSPSSDFQIALPRLSEPAFVEVLSEQGLGLLYFDLKQEDVDVPSGRVASVELSDDRRLSVSMTLVGGAPVVDVSYYDPLVEQNVEQTQLASSPLQSQDTLPPSEFQAMPSLRPKIWIAGTFSALKRWRPWFIGVLTGLGTISAIFQVHFRQSPTAARLESAPVVLAGSVERDDHQIPIHGAVRQAFSLEVQSIGSPVISSTVVESLRSADHPLQTLRLRSRSGRLLASHRVDAEGKIHDSTNDGPRDSPVLSRETAGLWQHIPDAADFLRLAGGDRPLVLRQDSDGYEVSFSRSSAQSGNSIVEAHLVLATGTLHPVAETLRFQDGQGAKEYRFREVHFEILPPQRVMASDFDADLYAGTRDSSRRTIYRASLTLQALELLAKQSRDVQTQVDIERQDDGHINVAGVLSTATEANTLRTLFRSLAGEDDLRLSLHSSDESSGMPSTSTSDFPHPMMITAERVPLDSLLRRTLSTRPDDEPENLDDRVRATSRDIIERGSQIHRAAWTTNQIAAKDFRSGEVEAMTISERKRWLALLARPLQVCEVNLGSISGAIFPGAEPAPANLNDAITSTKDLTLATVVFLEDAERLDRLIIDGFAVSSNVPSVPATPADLLKQMSEVWREERRLTSTVRRLQQAAQ
jgi:DNA-directed RNA polymerase specialized sigma24 family protein